MNNKTTKIEEFFREIDRVVIIPLHTEIPVTNEMGRIKEFFTIYGPWEEFKKLVEEMVDEVSELDDTKKALNDEENDLYNIKADITGIAEDLEDNYIELLEDVDDVTGLRSIIKKLNRLAI